MKELYFAVAVIFAVAVAQHYGIDGTLLALSNLLMLYLGHQLGVVRERKKKSGGG